MAAILYFGFFSLHKIVFFFLETSFAKSKPSIEGTFFILFFKLLISKSFVEIIPLIAPLSLM